MEIKTLPMHTGTTCEEWSWMAGVTLNFYAKIFHEKNYIRLRCHY